MLVDPFLVAQIHSVCVLALPWASAIPLQPPLLRLPMQSGKKALGNERGRGSTGIE